MAQTTINMGLTVWDLVTDNFSHTELRENFDAIDVHDHTADKGVKIPSGGLANLSVGTSQLQDTSVIGTKISNGVVSDLKLTSPNNVAYKTLALTSSWVNPVMIAGTWILLQGGIALNGFVTGSTNIPFAPIRLNTTDLAVAGKLTKLCVDTVVATNSIPPASTLTPALYPVSAVGGGADLFTMNVGAPVAGSTVAVTSPGPSLVTSASSGDFAHPVTGTYILGMSLSGPIATNSLVSVSARLRYRHT